MTNIKQIGLALVSVCLTSLLAQSIFAVDYKLQLDYETIDQKYLTEKTSDSTSTESYLGLVFENIPRTQRVSLYLYPNRQIADFLVKRKYGKILESIFQLNYDSASEDRNKTNASGQVNIGRRDIFSLKLAKGHALNTFRRGGNNLILEATKQEIHVVRNNTAKTIELGYASGGFNFAIIVENGANADSAFGGANYESDELASIVLSGIDPDILEYGDLFREWDATAAEWAASADAISGIYSTALASANTATQNANTASQDSISFSQWYSSFNELAEYHSQTSLATDFTQTASNASSALISYNSFETTRNDATAEVARINSLLADGITVEDYNASGDISLFFAVNDPAGTIPTTMTFETTPPGGVDTPFAITFAAVSSLNSDFYNRYNNLSPSLFLSLSDASFDALLDAVGGQKSPNWSGSFFRNLIEDFNNISTFEGSHIIADITGNTARKFYKKYVRNFETNVSDYIIAIETITGCTCTKLQVVKDLNGAYNTIKNTPTSDTAIYYQAAADVSDGAAIIVTQTALFNSASASITNLFNSFTPTIESSSDLESLFNNSNNQANTSQGDAETALTNAASFRDSAIAISGNTQSSEDAYNSQFTTSSNDSVGGESAALNSTGSATSDYSFALLRYFAALTEYSNAVQASNDASMDHTDALMTSAMATASSDYFETRFDEAILAAGGLATEDIRARFAVAEKLENLETAQSSNTALKINWKNKTTSVGLIYVTGSQTNASIQSSTATTGLGIKYQLNNISLFLNNFDSAVKSESSSVEYSTNVNVSLEKARANIDLGIDYSLNKNVGISFALASGSVKRIENLSAGTFNIQKETKNTHSIAELGIHTRLGKTAYLKLGYASTTETGKSSAGNTHPTLDGNFQLANGEKATTQQIKLRYQQSF